MNEFYKALIVTGIVLISFVLGYLFCYFRFRIDKMIKQNYILCDFIEHKTTAEEAIAKLEELEKL